MGEALRRQLDWHHEWVMTGDEVAATKRLHAIGQANKCVGQRP